MPHLTSCAYCERIRSFDPGYPGRPAQFDIGAEMPRCARHWRFACGMCERVHHYHGLSWCPIEGDLFGPCCGLAQETVAQPFWGWRHAWRRRCPFCAGWHWSLDYLEFQGEWPDRLVPSLEGSLRRSGPRQANPLEDCPQAEALAGLWSDNAGVWSAKCGPTGDLVRQVSDPVLFRLLGEVRGQTVVDAGCGQGYLSRLLAGRGAQVWGWEQAEGLVARAQAVEAQQPLGIRYRHGSVDAMGEIPSQSVDAVVANNVFMYCMNLEGALSEFGRVLKPGGRIVAVMTHPCFWGSNTSGYRLPPDSLRSEDEGFRVVGRYWHEGPYRFHPVDYPQTLVVFHRTFTTLFKLFAKAGLRVTDLEEPNAQALGSSLPTSVAFRLTR